MVRATRDKSAERPFCYRVCITSGTIVYLGVDTSPEVHYKSFKQVVILFRASVSVLLCERPLALWATTKRLPVKRKTFRKFIYKLNLIVYNISN